MRLLFTTSKVNGTVYSEDQMAYIWQNPKWPSYSYNKEKVDSAYGEYLEKEKESEVAFSILDEQARYRIHAKSIADEVVASLGIENETISFESVYSSVAKRLDVKLECKVKTDAYADSVSAVALDAISNHEPLTEERLNTWNRMLFVNYAGIKPRSAGSYRNGPEYIIKQTNRGPEVIYTAVPPDRVHKEMETFLAFVNSDKEKNPMIRSAIASQWFVVIHPYADGNGRISRAISDYILARGLEIKTSSMSSMILADRKEYYARLNAISTQDESLDLTDWIVWYMEIATNAQINAMETLKKTIRLTGFMKNLDPSVYNSREISILYKLADGSFYGKLTTEKWAKMTKCSTAAAQRDIRHLVGEGYLVPDGGKGPKTGYFLNEQFLFNFD